MLRSIIQGLTRPNRTPVTPVPDASLAEHEIAQLLTTMADDQDRFPLVCLEIRARAREMTPAENARLDLLLGALPDREYQILLHFKSGLKHKEIAALMDMDAAAVRASLVQIYSSLSLWMRGPSGPGGGQPMAPPHDAQA